MPIPFCLKSGAGKGKGSQGEAAGPDVPQGAKATGASLDNVASSIHAGQQGKHVLGHNNFLPGRSYLNEGVDPQKLLNGAHAGEFPVVGYGSRGQPIVDFGKNIGVDGTSGLTTRYGTIHSGKSGAHIVPTNPATVGAKP
jgi:filamentous hemagglutinin